MSDIEYELNKRISELKAELAEMSERLSLYQKHYMDEHTRAEKAEAELDVERGARDDFKRAWEGEKAWRETAEAEVERLKGADAEAQKYARMVYHLTELAKWRNPRQLEKFWKRFDEWSKQRVNPSGDTLGQRFQRGYDLAKEALKKDKS